MQLDELRHEYRELISPDTATEHDYRYLIDPAAAPVCIELGDALGELFAARPELDRVALVLGDTVIGVVHRSFLAEPPDPVSRSSAAPGSLPGMPTDYTPLYFQCQKCPHLQAVLFLEDGKPPLCGEDPAHGPTTRIAG